MKLGTAWVHDLGNETFRIYRRIFSGGSKNYGYKIVNTVTGERKTICKVRGKTLNYNALQLFNFDVIGDMILKEAKGTVTVHTANKIKRKRKGGGLVSIITDPEDKMY